MALCVSSGACGCTQNGVRAKDYRIRNDDRFLSLPVC